MMSGTRSREATLARRIEDGYRERFRSLLVKVRPRRLEFGVELLMGRAREMSRREAIPLPRALARVYEATRRRVERRLALTSACSLPARPPEAAAPRFLCDASLGGLARWLRAAGYEAEWVAEPGDALVGAARAREACLVTSDSRLMGRRAVRDGALPALWVPSNLTPVEQLGMVMRDLGLSPRDPRCMSCGGRLQPAPKDQVRERIPPRTALWKDDYFLCARCGKLFWQGTHWQRITRRLEGLLT